jgi:glycosyltransferase involved in cell wall biosynthesis
MSKLLRKKVWYIHPFAEIKADPMVDLGAHLRWCREIGVEIEGIIIGKKINHVYFQDQIDANKVHNVLYHMVESENSIIRRIGDFTRRLLNTLKIIILLKSKCSYNCMIFFISFDPLLFFMIALLFPKLNYILFVHFTQFYRGRLLKKICSYYLNRARKIFVIEKDVKRELGKIYSNLSSKIIVAETLFFDAQYKYIRSNKINMRTKFLFPGSIRTAKGIYIFLEAIRRLKGHEGMEFVLAGDVESVNMTCIHNDILNTQRILKDSIVFSGERFSNDQYYKLLKEVDYLVLPYLKKYYVGRASAIIYDAIKVGTPIIAPNYGVFKDYINRFKIGLLFEAEDPISLSNLMLHASKSNLSFDDGFKKVYSEFSEINYRAKFSKVFEI